MINISSGWAINYEQAYYEVGYDSCIFDQFICIHVCMMHIYIWSSIIGPGACTYLWFLILMNKVIIHDAFIQNACVHDARVYDACMHDVISKMYIIDPWTWYMYDLCMYYDPWSWYMHVWCIYLCSSILDYDACVYDAHIYDPGPWSWSMHVCMVHVSMMRQILSRTDERTRRF